MMIKSTAYVKNLQTCHFVDHNLILINLPEGEQPRFFNEYVDNLVCRECDLLFMYVATFKRVVRDTQ